MSDSKQEGALREFQPVDDANEALGMLREGGRSLCAAMIWTKNQEHVINTHLSVFSETEKTIYVWVPKDSDPKAFLAFMSAGGPKECFFSVSLSRANIFFKAVFLGHDDGGYKFKAPDKIFKVQRRSHLRFPIPDGYSMKVEFNDPLFPENRMTKKVVDMSAGGLAVIADEADDSLFQVGMVLHGVTFTVKARKITCDAEIRHKRIVPKGHRNSGLRMGLLFKGLKPADSQFLAAYVFDESRKFFSRIL